MEIERPIDQAQVSNPRFLPFRSLPVRAASFPAHRKCVIPVLAGYSPRLCRSTSRARTVGDIRTTGPSCRATLNSAIALYCPNGIGDPGDLHRCSAHGCHTPIGPRLAKRENSASCWLLGCNCTLGAEVVSRDRGGIYSDGTTRGAPQAVQVADRFHLLCNLTSAVAGPGAEAHRLGESNCARDGRTVAAIG